MGSRLDLTIMPTEDCNFRCVYCYERFSKGAMSSSNISFLKKFILTNVRKYTGISVSWFGGEPLEAINEMENITEILLMACKKRNIPYDAGIVTNGYNLTVDVLQKLIKMRVTQIQVTIDGTRENHNKYKCHKDGIPTFDVVLENLKYIRDYCTKNTLSIIVRTNVSFEILENINEIIDFYHEEFSKDKRFSFFFRPIADWGGESIKQIAGDIFDSSQFNTMYEKIAAHTTYLNYKLYHSELTKGIDICYAAKDNAYVIGSDLTLYKCSCKFNENYNIIGKINEKGQFDINEDLALKWVMIGATPRKECEECVLYPVCHNAACIADVVDGKISGSICPHMKHNLDSYLRILSRDPQYCMEL